MKFKTLITIYFAALAAECFALAFDIFPLQLLTKPSLMPILIFHYVRAAKNLASVKYFIYAALIFSWLGDIVLLLDKNFSNLFIFGLLGFLAAHLFYIVYFWRVRQLNCSNSTFKPLASIAVLAYVGLFYFSIFPHLENMKVPVFVYCAVISLMLLASFHAFNFKSYFAKLCIFGTVLFAVSDSILAVNRFVKPFALAPILVMLTYGIAQFLITEGSLRNLREIEK